MRLESRSLRRKPLRLSLGGILSMLAVVDVMWTKSDNRREVVMYIHEVKGITRRSHKTRRGEQ